MSHAWGASGLEGYVRGILGIKPIEPQYERVVISPLDFGTKLQWARGKITTDRGVISVAWQNNKEKYEMTFNIPVNVTGKIAIPAKDCNSTQVEFDGVIVKAERVEECLVLENIGSGEHNYCSG